MCLLWKTLVGGLPGPDPVAHEKKFTMNKSLLFVYCHRAHLTCREPDRAVCELGP